MARTTLSGTAYDVLGVAKTASADEIRTAYRKRARATHPDTGGDAEQFAEVQQAWELIGTENARVMYDRELTFGARMTQPGYPSSSFTAPYASSYASAGSTRRGASSGAASDEQQGYWATFGPNTVWMFRMADEAAAQAARARNAQRARVQPINTLAPLAIILAVIFPPAGIVAGHIALHQIKRRRQLGRRIALIGLGLSYILTIVQYLPLVLRLIAA